MADLASKDTLLKWYDENFCLQAVAFDWRLLQFVKNQTEEICKLAIRQDLRAFPYVKFSSYPYGLRLVEVKLCYS